MNLRRLALMACCHLICTGVAAEEQAVTAPGFGLYLVKDSKDDLDGGTALTDPAMYRESLLLPDDIKTYDAATCTFQVSKEAAGKVAAANHSTFAAVVDGKVIYTGKVVSSGSSVFRLCPVIRIEDAEKSGRVKIYLGYPKEDPGLRDLRNDPRLIACLTALGKIKPPGK